jgi:hypothetical protein
MPVTATVAQVMATAVTVAAALTGTPVTIADTTVLTVTPVTTAHITELTDTHVATVVIVAAVHTVTCQFAITVAAALTVTLVTIAHTMGLMDTHHSFRGIGFIDRFTLSQVTCPTIAPLVTRRTGVDVRCAPHALWLES